MPIPDLFKDAFASIDTIPFRSLSESDISNILETHIPADKTGYSTEEMAEIIAFRFLENYSADKNSWGTFFGPAAIRPNEEGSIDEFPSLSFITAATIMYWEERCTIAQHPVLAARYAGLAHDFHPKVTGQPANYLFAKMHCVALLDTIDQNLYKVHIYAVGKLRRALAVALQLNDEVLIGKVKATILQLENTVPFNEQRNWWGFAFDLLVGNKKKLLTPEEELTIIQQLHDRMTALAPVNASATEAAAIRLARYYLGKKNQLAIKQVLEALKEAVEKATSGAAPIQQAHEIDRLYHLFVQFQLHSEAQALLIQLRAISKETDKEMKSVAGSVTLSQDKIDEYVNRMLTGNSESIFSRIVQVQTPKIKEAKDELLKLSQVAPFVYLANRTLVDKKGRQIAAIGPLSEDPESHLVTQLSDTMRIGTLFLHVVFEEGEKRGIFTVSEILQCLKNSCIISEDRFFLFQKGLEAYFSKDYIVTLHVLIPQFEEAIRNLIELNGGSILVYKNNGYNLKNLDHLLRDKIISDVFGEDISLYFKVLFTDNRGWNLRNEIAHGILDPSHYNKQTADRLLHAILSLGFVRLIDKKEP